MEIVLHSLSNNRRHLAKVADGFVDEYDFRPTDDGLSDNECQAFMEARRNILFNANKPRSYLLHGKEITAVTLDVLVFCHPLLEIIHIKHWYCSKTSPLCDPDMLSQLSTTPLEMLSTTATGVSNSYIHVVHLLTVLDYVLY